MSSRRQFISPGPSWSTLSGIELISLIIHLLLTRDLDRREKKREFPPSDSDSGKETEVDELASPPPSNKRPKLAFYLASKSQSSLNFSARKPRLLQGGPDAPKHGQKRRPVSEGKRPLFASKSVPTCDTSHLRISARDREAINRSHKTKLSSRSDYRHLSPPTRASTFSPPPLDEVLRMPQRSVKKPGSGRRSPALSSRTKDGVSGSRKRRPDHRRSDSSPRKKPEGEYHDLGCIEITSSEDERPRATNKNKSAKNPVEVIEITDNSDNDSELIQHSTSHKARDRSQTSLTMSSSREPSVTFVYERKRTGAGSSIIYTPSSSVDVVGTRPDDRGAGSNSPSPANAGSSESPFAGPSTRPILQTPKIFERSCAFFGHKLTPISQMNEHPRPNPFLATSGRTPSSPVKTKVASPHQVDAFLDSCIARTSPRRRSGARKP
ncbi:hypothetical protein PQX77_017559 [Marasmius sp. AFHP31]|nr:hypothetical protein PQX77_017559 [Marasmius sp. AFHP31]